MDNMLWTADTVMYRGVSMDAAYSGDTLIWRKNPSTDYFTITVLTGGTIEMSFSGKSTEMKVNDSDFQVVGNRTLNVNGGDVIKFKGSEVTYFVNSYTIGFRGGSARFKVGGNIMSLLYPVYFDGKDFPSGSTFTFTHLFSGCSGLTDASELVLPRTTANFCYDNLFRNCSSLTSAPTLPATSLKEECYSAMFLNCTSLVVPPSLPATELGDICYMSMFKGCTSLSTTPELPATTLTKYCYDSMFLGCTSLTSATTLSATTLPEYCYASMFEGCTSLSYIKCLATSKHYGSTEHWTRGVSATGTFVKARSSTWETGEDGIPSGWTVQNP